MFHSLAFWGLVPFCVGANLHLSTRVRAWAITALSLSLILYLNPTGGAWLGGLVLMCWPLLRAATRAEGAARRRITWAGIALVVGNLLVFKYLPTGTLDWISVVGFPLGISFLSFRLIHLLVENSRNTLKPMSFSDYLLYAFFFGIWIAGPIQPYNGFVTGRQDRITRDDLVIGGNRVLFGLVKVFFISKTLLPSLYLPNVAPATIAANLDTVSFGQTWGYLIITYAILYCDFSGYSDLAIGLSRLFGFRIIENFAFPFLATNMADYWTRWHKSLSNFCTNYVYMPVLARFRRPTLALYASFFVMGVWHAASPHWILWGMYHATGITVYRRWDRFRRARLPVLKTGHPAVAVFNNLLTMLFVCGAGAFTSLNGKASVIVSFSILQKAVGL